MTYDYESKSSCSLTVTVRDGNGGVTSATVTVELIDVVPARPSAPTVVTVSQTSVRVVWTLPEGAVSAFVRYMKDGTVDWTEHPGNVSVAFLVLEGLDAGSVYHSQVLAIGPEGHSDWSEIGSGRTAASGGGDDDGAGGGNGNDDGANDGTGQDDGADDDDADDDDDSDDSDDDGDDTGGGVPLKAAMIVNTDCGNGLCRALTGVPVRFKDTSTGNVSERRWDFGDGGSSRGLTTNYAWSAPGFYEVALWVSDGSEESTASLKFLVEASDPAGSCEPDSETLCLRDSRFSVGMEWWTGDGPTGAGKVVYEGTNDSGLFYFFEPGDNWEVLIKVLNGCGLNDRVWVYGASATTLGYSIRVTDTETGEVRNYRKDPGEPAAAISDVGAFTQGCSQR